MATGASAPVKPMIVSPKIAAMDIASSTEVAALATLRIVTRRPDAKVYALSTIDPSL